MAAALEIWADLQRCPKLSGTDHLYLSRLFLHNHFHRPFSPIFQLSNSFLDLKLLIFILFDRQPASNYPYYYFAFLAQCSLSDNLLLIKYDC